jgi:hypothetical protein
MSARARMAIGLCLGLALVAGGLHAQPAPAPSPAPVDEPAAVGGSAAAPPPAAAASLPEGHEPKLQVKVDPQAGVRTGELVKLEISADAVLGDDVTIAEQSFAPFEVHKKQLRVEPPQGQRQRFVFNLELLAFEPGDKPIPAISLRVVTKDNFVGTVKTSEQPFKVRGLLDNEPNAQPKLETKPVPVLEDNWIPVYIFAGLLAAGVVALATVLISRWLRKRKAKAVPPPPPRPPWEIATEALAELRRKKQSMIEAGQGAQFVELLSHVIRAYLGGRYHFDGLETTTDEMLAQLKAHEAGLGFTQEVGMFLGRCDLVKFAKVEPDADEVDLLFAKAQDLVQFSGPDESRGLTPPKPPSIPPDPSRATPPAATTATATATSTSTSRSTLGPRTSAPAAPPPAGNKTAPPPAPGPAVPRKSGPADRGPSA